MYLEYDGADEFDTLNDGLLTSGYRHASFCGVRKQVSGYLDLRPCALFMEEIREGHFLQYTLDTRPIIKTILELKVYTLIIIYIY